MNQKDDELQLAMEKCDELLLRDKFECHSSQAECNSEILHQLLKDAYISRRHARDASKLQAEIDEFSLKPELEEKGVADLDARLQANKSMNDALRWEKIEVSRKLEHAEKTIDDLKAESELLKGKKLESVAENNMLKQEFEEYKKMTTSAIKQLMEDNKQLKEKTLIVKEKEASAHHVKISAQVEKLKAEKSQLFAQNKNLKLNSIGFKEAHARDVSKLQAKIDELGLKLEIKEEEALDLVVRLEADKSRNDALRLEKLEGLRKLEQADKTIHDLKAESELLRREKLQLAAEINRMKQEFEEYTKMSVSTVHQLIEDSRRLRGKKESLVKELDVMNLSPSCMKQILVSSALENRTAATETTNKRSWWSTKHGPRKSNQSHGSVVKDDDWSVVEDEDWSV